MPRQLIVCCDGTSNNLTGRVQDTNVAKLCELLDTDNQQQLLYYDPGVGNSGVLPDTTPWEWVRQTSERVASLAFGIGIYENIAQAYRFLMQHWQPGDQIFLFGFSRGAFTARCVGGLVTQFGVLRPEAEAMVPTLLHVYFLDRERHRDVYQRTRAQISQLFTSEAAREAPVWFVGVWDTVASVGMPLIGKQITGSPTIVGKRFMHVRQALALDEHRYTFAPRPYEIERGYDYAAHQQSVAQQWFSGAHCDVGGGYPNAQTGLSQQALLWLVQEATQCQLRLRADLVDAQGQAVPQKITAVLAAREVPHTTTAPRQLVHSASYTSAWWALAGLRVRNPYEGEHPGKERPTEPPQQSPTVHANGLQFPQQTVWRRTRPLFAVMLAILFSAVLFVVLGALLAYPIALHSNSNWLDWVAAFQTAAHANAAFSEWQLLWWWRGQAPGAGLGAFDAVRSALVLDLPFIAAYGYLLARATSWAFAWVARLRTVSTAVPRWLNRLGFCACVMVLADVAENLFTFMVVGTANSNQIPLAAWPFGAAMSLASLFKWVGLVGCAALVGWAGIARMTRKTVKELALQK